MNEELLDLLDRRISRIALDVFRDLTEQTVVATKGDTDRSEKIREQLTFIKAKEHITVKEAALLLSCSDSHIRKLVMLARKRKTAHPIPFVELENMTVFPVQELLTWAKPQARLHVLKNEAA